MDSNIAENIVIYDWLSFTSKRHSPDQIISILGLSHVPWVESKGARGYRCRKYFSCISIHYDGRDDTYSSVEQFVLSLNLGSDNSGYYYNIQPMEDTAYYGIRVFYKTGSFGGGRTHSDQYTSYVTAWLTDNSNHAIFCTSNVTGRLSKPKQVWCRRRKKMVTQRIKVISNVSLCIPYEDFISLEQVVLAAERNRDYDDEHDTLTVTLVLGDEFSVQMNSRNFKTNIDPLFLNTILTCRHYYISLYYTAQRFGHVDALLRQVTSYVIECDKLWRFQRLNAYDAWDLENATNTQLIAPIQRSCWFVRNEDYEAYDTLACVGNLKKSMQEGDMMTEAEILALQQNTQDANMEAVSKPSRKWVRRQRQTKK